MRMDNRAWWTLVGAVFVAGLLVAAGGGWAWSLVTGPKFLFNCAVVLWVISLARLFGNTDHKEKFAWAVTAAMFVFADEFAERGSWLGDFPWLLMGVVPLAWATIIAATAIEQAKR